MPTLPEDVNREIERLLETLEESLQVPALKNESASAASTWVKDNEPFLLGSKY